MQLSYSQLSDWLQCRYKWFLGYDYRCKGLAEKHLSGPLVKGSAVHAALDALLQAQYGYEAGTFQVPPMLDDGLDGIAQSLQDRNETIDGLLADDCAKIAYHAFKALDWKKYRVATLRDGKSPAVEVYVEAPLPGGHTFRGYVDLILEDRKSGELWIVDHKVRKRFAWAGDFDVDMQLAVYQYILQHQGYDITGGAYHEIRSDLLDMWSEDDQGQIKPNGRSKANPFKFTRLYKSPAELRGIWENVVKPAAVEIALYGEATVIGNVDVDDMNGNPNVTPRVLQPNICGRCQFKDLCTAALADEDAEFIRDEQFEFKNRG